VIDITENSMHTKQSKSTAQKRAFDHAHTMCWIHGYDENKETMLPEQPQTSRDGALYQISPQSTSASQPSHSVLSDASKIPETPSNPNRKIRALK